MVHVGAPLSVGKLFTARLNIFGNAVTFTITFKITLLYYDIHQHFVTILSVTEMKWLNNKRE